MYVCLCMAITDSQARAAVESGAETVAAVLRACGSAKPCGGCTPTIRRLIRERREPSDAGVVELDRYREAR